MEERYRQQDKKDISRGDFIKKAAIATAGFYIVPRYVLGGKGYMAPSDKLYIAAVGCGGEAENDIHHYATAPKKNAEIAFLCDVDDRWRCTATERISESQILPRLARDV